MTPEQTAAVAIVGEKLMGWTVCKDTNCEGCDAYLALFETPRGGEFFKGPLGRGSRWNPFADCNADYAVLEAVRAKWSGEQLYSFIERLKGIRWARSEVTLSYSLEVMHHQPGDYTLAAAEVLKGDAT